MNKLLLILVFAYIFASCGAKKPLHGFQEATVFKLVEERTLKTRLWDWKAEVYHEPLINSHFIYRNYDVYFVFHPMGRLSRILLPKTAELSEAWLERKGRINGTYFQRGNSKVLTYQYYDVVNDKRKTDRTTFELNNDTLQMNQGRKLLVRMVGMDP